MGIDGLAKALALQWFDNQKKPNVTLPHLPEVLQLLVDEVMKW